MMVVSQGVVYVIAGDMTPWTVKTNDEFKNTVLPVFSDTEKAQIWLDTFMLEEDRDFWFPRAVPIAEAIKMVSIMGTVHTAPREGSNDGVSEVDFFAWNWRPEDTGNRKLFDLAEMLEVLRGYQTDETIQ
jgi:hypothetical protein